MTAKTLQLSDALHAYLVGNSLREIPLQRALREATRKIPGAGMQITPEQGQFMQLLVRMLEAKRCIEIGTFTGYSSLAVALALPPGGRIVCCDISEEWTSVAHPYWKKAGVRNKIDLRIGPALETLKKLKGKFDFAFIDADKTNYQNYYERCLNLIRKGGLIAIDNTLWGGSVIDASKQSADTRAIRAFNGKLHRDRRVDISMVPIGDGLTLAFKR
jgi:caffeoyl-CoA O-methyltransferase